MQLQAIVQDTCKRN